MGVVDAVVNVNLALDANLIVVPDVETVEAANHVVDAWVVVDRLVKALALEAVVHSVPDVGIHVNMVVTGAVEDVLEHVVDAKHPVLAAVVPVVLVDALVHALVDVDLVVLVDVILHVQAVMENVLETVIRPVQTLALLGVLPHAKMPALGTVRAPAVQIVKQHVKTLVVPLVVLPVILLVKVLVLVKYLILYNLYALM